MKIPVSSSITIYVWIPLPDPHTYAKLLESMGDYVVELLAELQARDPNHQVDWLKEQRAKYSLAPDIAKQTVLELVFMKIHEKNGY